MSQAVVWKNGDRVSITIPSNEYKGDIKDLPGVPEGVEKIVCQRDSIPSDRTFRDAWEFDAASHNGCKCNMDKAKEIARSNVRVAREAPLAKLDVEVTKAVESGWAVDPEVTAAKKKLRDAPADPRIANATDEAGLKAAMNEVIEEVKAVA